LQPGNADYPNQPTEVAHSTLAQVHFAVHVGQHRTDRTAVGGSDAFQDAQ